MKTPKPEMSFSTKQWMPQMRVALFITLLFLASHFSNAQVIYIDIIPDTTISAIGGYYDLDLNNDGISDYQISRGGIDDFNFIGIGQLHDSCYVSYYNIEGCIYAKAYLANEVIGVAEQWTNGANIANYGGTTTCMHSGAFPGQTDAYLGLKLIVNGMNYFGWVRIDVASDATWFRLKDYAYDSNPIVAGDGITSVNNQSTDKNITIFPNPTKGSIHINCKNKEAVNIKITDTRGKVCYSKKILGSGQIDMTDYPQGIYFIQGIGNTLNHVQKIIKN